MNKFNDLYHKAKRNLFAGDENKQRITKEEIIDLENNIFGVQENISRYAIMSFGILEDPSERNVQRVKWLTNHFISRKDDDRLRSCFYVVVVCWSVYSKFVEEATRILDEKDHGIFVDSLHFAATCLADAACDGKSKELLGFLVSEAKKSVILGESPVRTELLVNAALMAATGEQLIDTKVVRSYLSERRLDTIQFGMQLVTMH
jgi:hypothetical protein